jgi:hypothetical protein
MIVNTSSGLGNTLTDVGSDVNSGQYINLPNTLVQGLINGDGWAYGIVFSLGYILYRAFGAASSGVHSGVSTLAAIPKARKKKKAQKFNSKIDEQISKLQATKLVY